MSATIRSVEVLLLLDWLAPPLFLLGHLAIWSGVFNRLHAVNLPCRAVSRLEKLVLAAAALPLFGFAAALVWGRYPLDLVDSFPLLWLYVIPCIACGMAVPVLGLARRLTRPGPTPLRRVHSEHRDFRRSAERPLAGDFLTRCLAFPGNQIFQLEVNRKTLAVPGLPPEFEGLRIAHLSDLHFSGQIRREYFDRVIDELVALRADLVVLTGDIVERETCLAWLAPTLGRVRGPDGCWFVLGNHDKRLARPEKIREQLADCGWTDLGGRAVIRMCRGRRLLLAGNELPWFGPPPEMAHGASAADFRLLLSHSPDQLPWARRHDFQLLLAGHTHGGQVRAPLFGPLVAPSRYGTRYAAGVFHEPPTVMHVSRGISGLQPLRVNCPPELTLLELQVAPTTASSATPGTVAHSAAR